MLYTPFIWPLVFAALINGGLAVYARRFRNVPAAPSFSLLMAFGSLTALIYGLEISAVSLPLRIFFSELRFIPLAPLAPTLFVFVLEYLGLGNRLSRLRIALIYLIPIFTVLLSLSGDSHHLFRYNFHLDESGAVTVLLFSRGIWWFIYFIYSFVLELVSCGLLLGSFYVRALSYRNTLAVTFGLIFVIAIDILYNLRLTPFPGYYWTPSAFVLTGALFGWAVLRGRMLDVAPVARHAVIENMDDLVIVLDTQNHIVDINPAAQTACGLSPQAIGAYPAEALPPDWAGLVRRYSEPSVAPLSAVVKEEVVVASGANGSGVGPRVYELTLSPVQDRRRRTIGRLFLFRDITKRKQMEQALRASEERFRQLFYNAPIAVAVLQASKIVMANPATIRLVGAASLNDLIGKPFLDVVHPDFRASVAQRASTLLAGVGVEPSFEEKLLCLDGSVIDVEVTSAEVTYADQPAIQTMIVDITERKRIVGALQVSEEHFRSLFEHMLDGFAYCKMLYQDQKAIDFIYLEVNRAFEELTGLVAVEGRKVSDVIPGIQASNPELFEVYGRVALTGEPERLETFIASLDIWFSTSVYSTRKEYFVAIFENITERKRAEELILKSLEEKEVLLKEIHHRVKNNLTVVSSLLELQARASQDERLKSAFQNSQQRIQAMSAIHEQLYRSDDLAHIDMAKYIASLAEELRSAYARTDVALQVAVTGVYLDIDQAIPCGLLLNELLTNAFKYAFAAADSRPAGGSCLPDSQINVALHLQDGHYILRVSDNGCGLPDGFDLQATRSLGLKLVNRLAAQLHGEPEVASVVGQGTTITIKFPIQE